jgi:predicted nucleotidyltransferase
MPKMGMKKRLAAGKRRTAARKPIGSRTSLADALFSATQQKVLGLLFGQPGRTFFSSEIIGRVGGGSGAVQRELARLEQSGLAISSRVGNQKHFQANPAAPIFDELKRIVAKTFGVAEPIARALLPLSSRIVWAVIYGSVAKHADTANSDIDILIVGDQLTLEAVFNALDPVERQLQRKVNPTVLTGSEFAKRVKAGQGFISSVVEGEYLPILGDMDVAPSAREPRRHRQPKA